ncbi:hypothetical protein LMG27952_07725 [Paraburkholderia hiiakae]|uniref:Uncharacterized protein n=1 Tax=Paraburkholderia hiiakae TaxID=1081782 RepID=A0ABM8PBS0_9BURK|nr:hypothetical protein LMG27952_07725 [Paraburkholderia hiiakae]
MSYAHRAAKRRFRGRAATHDRCDGARGAQSRHGGGSGGADLGFSAAYRATGEAAEGRRGRRSQPYRVGERVCQPRLDSPLRRLSRDCHARRSGMSEARGHPRRMAHAPPFSSRKSLREQVKPETTPNKDENLICPDQPMWCRSIFLTSVHRKTRMGRPPIPTSTPATKVARCSRSARIKVLVRAGGQDGCVTCANEPAGRNYSPCRALSRTRADRRPNAAYGTPATSARFRSTHIIRSGTCNSE